MATHNVTIRRWGGGTEWETIYPKTIAENIIGGTLDPDRIPELDADKITSGTIDALRLPAIALTNVIVTDTLVNFLVEYENGTTPMEEGDVVIAAEDNTTYIHNGNEFNDGRDFSPMGMPTDTVKSVAGKTGHVTLTKGDVGLGNVNNTSDADKPISTATAAALASKVQSNPAITAATKTKITYDAKGLVTGGADLDANDIPNLHATKINDGVFSIDRIPSIPASKITGALDSGQIPILAMSKISGLSNALADKQSEIYLVDDIALVTKDVGRIVFEKE